MSTKTRHTLSLRTTAKLDGVLLATSSKLSSGLQATVFIKAGREHNSTDFVVESANPNTAQFMIDVARQLQQELGMAGTSVQVMDPLGYPLMLGATSND